MTYLDALKHQVDADLAVCQQELASLEDHRLPELKTRLQELLAAKAVLDRDDAPHAR